jgi:xeroderma pigmentosum group C-complementing protein
MWVGTTKNFHKAFWEAEKEAADKAEAKKREQILKRWTKLVQGLRIRQRMLDQYSRGASDNAANTIEVVVVSIQCFLG